MSRITNDVGQVQRAVSETIGDLARESLSLIGFAGLLFYYDPRLATVCLTGAPHDAAKPGGARAYVPRQRRGVYRPSHRQGVWRRGARDDKVRTVLGTL